MLTAVTDAPTATEARAVERALHKRGLESQRRNVARVIHDEVELRTAELRRDLLRLADTVEALAARAGADLDPAGRDILVRTMIERKSLLSGGPVM